jgi:hypothetical protein
MRPFKYLPTIAVAVVIVSCLAASTFAATPRQATASAARMPAAAHVVPAQSADAYGACYTWLRITPWLEMCNEGTRLFCDTASNITTGSRFVENERCPDDS